MRVLSCLLLAACYRGDASTPIVTPGPIEQPPQMCSADDDLARPVVDGSGGRLRVHSRAPLTAVRGRAGGQAWIGPAVPPHVPKRLGTLELMLLDEVEGGHLALYRDPYDRSSCKLGDDSNCAYEVRRYRDGALEWSLPLGKLLSRGDHLEVQDIRLAGGILYFNEACQTYSNEAGGECSSLVAVDPKARRVLWRTPALTSNNRFVVRGCYIVAGYGFTSEPDAVFLIDRGSGQVVQKLPLSTAPESYKLASPDQVDVTLYSGTVRRYRLDKVAARGGKLIPLDADEAFGGAQYGGAAYGGASRP